MAIPAIADSRTSREKSTLLSSMRRRSGTRMLAAVLFTDIVDSTAVASRLGDARWKELIARHHAIVRRELKRFGGKELDTAGDGFYASFSEPASAIRCACAATESVRELGIEIRTGVTSANVSRSGTSSVAWRWWSAPA